MNWDQAKKEFINVKPQSDSDRAAQAIVMNIRNQDEMRATYRAAPDLFHSIDHPRLNYLCFNMLGK